MQFFHNSGSCPAIYFVVVTQHPSRYVLFDTTSSGNRRLYTVCRHQMKPVREINATTDLESTDLCVLCVLLTGIS